MHISWQLESTGRVLASFSVCRFENRWLLIEREMSGKPRNECAPGRHARARWIQAAKASTKCSQSVVSTV